MGYNLAKNEMKKILLVLVTLMGIGFGAKAQSCVVGDNSYVAVRASVNHNQIVCTATWEGENTPTSGTVYATVYYIDLNGEETYEMITIRWVKANPSGNLVRDNIGNTGWYGSQRNVKRILRWEVSAGACQIQRN